MKRFFQGAYFGVCALLLMENLHNRAKPEEYIGLAILFSLGFMIFLLTEK